jgi:hypothetical protein
MLGAFSAHNTLGGTSKLTSDNTGTNGIPNYDGLLMPPGTTFLEYNSSTNTAWKENVAERFDLRMHRTFIRTLVLENDQNGDGIIDELEDELAADPSPCGVTLVCIADQNGPKVWMPADDTMKEAQRFDNKQWSDVLTYDNNGVLTGDASLEDVKFKSAVIFEYDSSLLENLPVGFDLPSSVGSSNALR